MKTFKEYVDESPQKFTGNAPFEDMEKSDIINSISRKIMNLDYKLIKKNLIKGVDLYSHSNGTYYVLGKYFTNEHDKERFGVVTDISFKLSRSFRSKQRQLKGNKVIIINTIHTTKEWRGYGLSTALYSYLVNEGYMIISDKVQYEGAINLWKGFLDVPNSKVYIYNMQEDKIISKVGKNTNDSCIWSDDTSKQKIRLIFTK